MAKKISGSVGKGGKNKPADNNEPDSFIFNEHSGVDPLGLLLPAVQQAREEEESFDDFSMSAEDGQSALLLPAVSAAREAARRTSDEQESRIDDLAVETEYDAFTLVELLVV